MKGLASGQHCQNRFHAALPGFRLFRGLQPVGDCVAICFVERIEERFAPSYLGATWLENLRE